MAKKYIVTGTVEKKGPYIKREESVKVEPVKVEIRKENMTEAQHSMDELMSSINMIIDFIGNSAPLNMENEFQRKVYDTFNKKYPITMRPKAVYGMVRIPSECMIMRAEDLIDAQNERDSKFAAWISKENKDTLEELYNNVPRIKGIDNVERVDYKSEEYEDYTALKSQLMHEAGLDDINEKVLSLSLLSENAVNKLIKKSNISLSLDRIPTGWSEHEILFAAITMLKPEDCFNLLNYYNTEVIRLFEDGKVTEGTRNYWRSNFGSMNKFKDNVRNDLGDYNLEELMPEEKLNYAMAIPFTRLYNWIGIYTPGVDNLANGETHENFHPSKPFDFKYAVNELKSYYGTPVNTKKYFDGKLVCEDQNGEFDSYKLINAIYNTFVDQLGFEVKEMKAICGFTTKEIDEFMAIKEKANERKAKNIEAYKEIKLTGKLLSFQGEYRCLGTYCKIPVPIKDEMGVAYNTIEEYFQCSKFADIEDREYISKLGPKIAGNEAKSVKMFELKSRGWDGEKVMLEAIKKRAEVDEYFKTALKDTAKRGLFIKCCFGNENQPDLNDYGYCLMKARSEF